MTEVLPAELNDVEDMVQLIELGRQSRQDFRPVFWRLAEDSREKTKPWFETLIGSDTALCFIARQDGSTVGFVIATEAPVPPVYDPGGPTWVVDDFAISNTDDWRDVGRSLFLAVRLAVKDRGAKQIVVVSAVNDTDKISMHEELGLEATSVWHTQTLES